MSETKSFEPKHYWICNSCAEKNGGKLPENSVSTAIKDECGYCGNLVTLWPWVDFDWPSKSITKRARIMRD